MMMADILFGGTIPLPAIRQSHSAQIVRELLATRRGEVLAAIKQWAQYKELSPEGEPPPDWARQLANKMPPVCYVWTGKRRSNNVTCLFLRGYSQFGVSAAALLFESYYPGVYPDLCRYCICYTRYCINPDHYFLAPPGYGVRIRILKATYNVQLTRVSPEGPRFWKDDRPRGWHSPLWVPPEKPRRGRPPGSKSKKKLIISPQSLDNLAYQKYTVQAGILTPPPDLFGDDTIL